MSNKKPGRYLRNTLAQGLAAVAPGVAAKYLERAFVTPQLRPMSPSEQNWIAGAARGKAAFDRGYLPLYSWGEGPVVLLVHGMSGRASQLAVYARPLVEAGYRVVAFDAPAHGEAGGSRATLPDFARAVHQVGSQLGPLAAVIAHSLGAAATAVALSKGLECERAILLAPPENPRHYLDMVARYFGFGTSIADRAQARIEAASGLTFASVRGLALASSLQLPVLLLHDQDDRMVPPSESKRLVEAWPQAHLIMTRGLGHNRIVRDARVMQQVIEFITGEPAVLPRAA